MILKDIKTYVALLKSQFKDRVNLLAASPQLAIIQVGNVEASNRYIKNKVKDCEEVGIVAHVYHFEEVISEKDLIFEVQQLSEFYNGIIVQLPLPPHIHEEAVTAAIPAEKDVDGFRNDSCFHPATPKGIMDYLKYCEFDLCGKDVVIIGRSNIVGKPLAAMMTDADATVTLCHSKSSIDKYLREADLIVSAVGKAGFLNCYPIYVPVIDVGINFIEVNGKIKLVGDAFNIEKRDVTPVPGGVGLLTRCALLDNVITAARSQIHG